MENPFDNMPPRQQPEEKSATESYGFAPRPSRRGLYTVLAVIAMLTVAAIFVRGSWVRIKNTEVTGLITYTKQRVLEEAGITARSTYFNLNEKTIRRGIEDDRYLRYIGMEKLWPNGLILHVQERRRQGNVLFMGVQYVISSDGMVLESSNSINLDNGCAKVTGLDLRDIRYGAPLVCQDESQLEAMTQLFEELEIQGVLGEIAEMNLSSLEKVGTVRAVVQELRRRQAQGGMIEATVPGQASYRPIQ